MKTLFAVVAVLLLSAFLPGEVLAAANKVSVEEMSVIKKAADEALAAAKLLVEKAKTEEEKSLAKELLEYAEFNAEVAADLLKTVQEGGSVDRETAENCAAVAKAVHKAAAAIAAGNAGKAGEMLNGISEMEDGMFELYVSIKDYKKNNSQSPQTSTPTIGAKCAPTGTVVFIGIRSYWKDHNTRCLVCEEYVCKWDIFRGSSWYIQGTELCHQVITKKQK